MFKVLQADISKGIVFVGYTPDFGFVPKMRNIILDTIDDKMDLHIVYPTTIATAKPYIIFEIDMQKLSVDEAVQLLKQVHENLKSFQIHLETVTADFITRLVRGLENELGK